MREPLIFDQSRPGRRAPTQAPGVAAPTGDLPADLLRRTPPPLRTPSISSRTDGVVAWQTYRHEKRSRLVHDIEVTGSHIGMGWNREVLAAVSDRLGQQHGPWRRYVSAP